MELTNSNSCWRDDLLLRNPNWGLERGGFIKSMLLSYISLLELLTLYTEERLGGSS